MNRLAHLLTNQCFLRFAFQKISRALPEEYRKSVMEKKQKRFSANS